MTPDANGTCVFAVKRGDIEKREIYCNSLYPFYISLIERYKNSPYYCGSMMDYLDINPKTDCRALTDESLVSFVPMPNVQEKNNMVEYDLVPYRTVKKGFTVFQKGDLIWAKITPCMQNGKSCIVDDMPTEIGFGSTEFHVVRKRNNKVYMPFIWSIFSNENVLKAAQAVFSGSAGQQRVSASFIENFPCVIPEYQTQVALVSMLENKLSNLKSQNQEALNILTNFENSISQHFNLHVKNANRMCFAIQLKDLDGVIDAKRYASMTTRACTFDVNDVCDIVDEKVNVSRFGEQVIDWIRIDDLPNQPLDIKEVRTQPANEVEGSFFEVREGDILVARLGPTILNQKIVMVRSLERTTIASAEFLVLRCKDGYNPEAVMAVLKTAYYRDLMYSHARGSTPSRYRLNREDMLKLPFPDIREHQEQIAADANRIREQVKAMRIQAEEDWQTAKSQFEKSCWRDENARTIEQSVVGRISVSDRQ